MVDLTVLKRSLDGATVANVVAELVMEYHRRAIDDIEVVACLVSQVLPVWKSLEPTVQKQLQKIVAHSPVFLNHIVVFTSQLVQTGAKEAYIYQEFVKTTLYGNFGCFYHAYVQVGNNMEHAALQSLLFGSKLYNMLSNMVPVHDYLENLIMQWKYLLDSDIWPTLAQRKIAYLTDYLQSMLTIHTLEASQLVFENLFLSNQKYFDQFQTILNSSPVFKQKRIINTALIPYLERKVNHENCIDVYLVLKRLHLVIDPQIILNTCCSLMQEILIRLYPLKLLSKLTLAMLDRFKMVDELLDETTCRALTLVLVYRTDTTHKEAIVHSTRFLDAVTKRLGHDQTIIRERTMYIAKLVTDGALEYESDFKIAIPNLDLPKDDIPIKFASFKDSFSQPNLQDTNQIERLATSTHELTLQDSDDEDEDGVVRRHIVFLKDLVQEFEQHNKRSDLVPLLKKTVQLVRQKKDYFMEVDYYIPSLLPMISALNNNLDESQFEDWRINALVSLIVVAPKRVVDLFKILFNEELSLQQRMSLLTSVALAARNLRGYKDKQVIEPVFDFPSKRLPWDQTHLIKEYAIPETARLLSNAQTIWKSSKLEKQESPTMINKFRQYSTIFFYPLANGWLNGIQLGTYDRLFKTHYYWTLHTVYTCAYPVHDYESMERVMEDITAEALQENLPITK